MKNVIIMNGSGEAGKDTLCDFAKEQYPVMNVSSIDPIKQIAEQVGWDGTKDPKSRKFLSDLKKISTDYNEFPTEYLVSKFLQFMCTGEDRSSNVEEIMFVHIREPKEIDKFINRITYYENCIRIRKVLVTRGEEKELGNESDDGVRNYEYDFIFENNGTLEEAKKKWLNEVLPKVLS